MAKQILILPGDGVGKEVSTSAVEVLDYFICYEDLIHYLILLSEVMRKFSRFVLLALI